MKPKIKVRLPKLQNLIGKSWAKELTLSFVGTTLSIVLTFGTAHFVDAKQNREAGRQVAMMVIHDMENSADYFSRLAREDEAIFNLTSNVLSRQDRLDTIPHDTLFSFVNAITSPAISLYNYDDASEKIFVSSPEAWENIDNAAFIDAVQTFYKERRDIYAMLNSDKFFVKPITHEDYYRAVIEASDQNGNVRYSFMADLLREHIARKDVQYYISQSTRRRAYFTYYSNQFMSTANKCKFLMGISDEELAAYVAQTERSGRKLKGRMLVGAWEVQGDPNDYHEIQFRRDHSLLWNNCQYLPHAIYTGNVEFRFTIPGTWEIEGDSLVISLLPQPEYSLDTTHIRYQPDKKEYLDRQIAAWQRAYDDEIDELKRKGGQRDAYFSAIAAAGNKIEPKRKKTDKSGNEQEEILYLVKK